MTTKQIAFCDECESQLPKDYTNREEDQIKILTVHFRLGTETKAEEGKDLDFCNHYCLNQWFKKKVNARLLLKAKEQIEEETNAPEPELEEVDSSGA